ncbi:hypothetical protein [Cytobacillus sp. FSL H8-0458]
MTVKSLLNDLEIASVCGSAGVVVHFGNPKSAARIRLQDIN